MVVVVVRVLEETQYHQRCTHTSAGTHKHKQTVGIPTWKDETHSGTHMLEMRVACAEWPIHPNHMTVGENVGTVSCEKHIPSLLCSHISGYDF